MLIIGGNVKVYKSWHYFLFGVWFGLDLLFKPATLAVSCPLCQSLLHFWTSGDLYHAPLSAKEPLRFFCLWTERLVLSSGALGPPPSKPQGSILIVLSMLSILRYVCEASLKDSYPTFLKSAHTFPVLQPLDFLLHASAHEHFHPGLCLLRP